MATRTPLTTPSHDSSRARIGLDGSPPAPSGPSAWPLVSLLSPAPLSPPSLPSRPSAWPLASLPSPPRLRGLHCLRCPHALRPARPGLRGLPALLDCRHRRSLRRVRERATAAIRLPMVSLMTSPPSEVSGGHLVVAQSACHTGEAPNQGDPGPNPDRRRQVSAGEGRDSPRPARPQDHVRRLFPGAVEHLMSNETPALRWVRCQVWSEPGIHST